MNDEPILIEYQEAEPPPRYGAFWSYQDLAILIGLALPALIIAALAVRAAGLIDPESTTLSATAALAMQFLTYAIWFLCLWALIRFRYDRPFWISLAWVRPARSLLLFAAAGPFLAYAVGMLGGLLQTPEVEMPMLELLRDRRSLVLVGTFAVTLGPIAEELIFRGFVLPLLARSLGPVVGVLLTSAAFALLHGAQYAWSWQHLTLIGGAGAAFGVVRLLSGSTAAATMMHATYNMTLFLAVMASMEDY